MFQTIEIEIEASGRVRAVEPGVTLRPGRALLTLLGPQQDEATVLAEQALSEDWLRPEEDAAWAHLQPAR